MADDSLLLKLFQNLEKSPQATQRKLSSQLGIALGMTNMLLKRAAKKGYLKIKKTKARGAIYQLTQTGSVEKGRLMLEQIQQTLSFYNDARDLARDCLETVKKNHIQKIAIHGTSNVSEIIYLSAKEMRLDVVGAVDLNRVNQRWLDLPCLDFEQLKSSGAQVLILDFLKKDQLADFDCGDFPCANLIEIER